VILAAGRGTRMRSDRAKVLHELRGLPLVTWVCRAVRPVVDRTVVVIGHDRDAVRAALEGEEVVFAVQETQLGTGHALQCAAHALGEADTLLVLAGDAPMISTESIRGLLAEHAARSAAATILTFRARDPAGYGRIVRDARGHVVAIVEDREATSEQRLIDEVNSGAYAFDASLVLPLLPGLPRRAQGEYYLTDAIAALVAGGRVVSAHVVPEVEAMGINTPEHLAAAEVLVRARTP